MFDPKKKVVVSGMRPTGKLHLGHYHGVIENWVNLQSDPSFQNCFFFVADWHSLTTEYENASLVKTHIRDIVVDWLSYGIDPQKAVIFIQSAIPEHVELHLLLSMITPVSWLERVPSYKELQKELSGKDLSTYGFLGYPLLQTADVALYHGTHVPVGQDQVAHIEVSREIVRRCNFIFKKELLPEPEPLLTKTAKLPGTDGRKMSKSYNNSVFLSDSAEDVKKKILPMMTDPARIKRTDPGDPAKCPVFDFHQVYSTEETREVVTSGCKSAGIGCVDCKKLLLSGMDQALEPFRDARRKMSVDTGFVDDVIRDGNEKARQMARSHWQKIRDEIGF